MPSVFLSEDINTGKARFPRNLQHSAAGVLQTKTVTRQVFESQQVYI